MSTKRLLPFLVFAVSPLWAQYSSSGAINRGQISLEKNRPAPQAKKRIEKFEVTGSHIKRVDIEGPSPIRTLDSDYLQTTGHNSVADVLRDISANSFGSRREQSGSSVAGVASVNLRGLGANRTLVLLNGRRIAKDGIAGTPDLNLIPMIAVERIDILKDSASATYGSDAIGGTINVITKKDFNGSEVNMRQDIINARGGNKRTVSLVHGASNSKGNIVSSIQYRKNEKVFSRDREWSKEGSSNFSPHTNVNVGDGNGYKPGPGCPSANVSSRDGRCKFNFANFSTETPEIEQVNIFTNGAYEANGNIKFFGQANATLKKTNWQYAPGTVNTSLQGAFVDAQNLPGHTAGEAVNILWRSLPLGNRVSETKTTAFGGTVGTTAYLSDTWDITVSGGTEVIKRDDRSPEGYANADKLKAVLESGQYNVFNGTGAIPEDVRYETWEIMQSEITHGEVKGSGELITLPGGAAAMALGTTYSYEKFTDTFDPLSTAQKVTGGGAGSNGYGTRQVLAAYSELSLPLHKTFELQFAGRYDRYSDFGDTLNPKVALKWRPTPVLMFRASAGTGFKAPDMVDMYNGGSAGFPTFIDAKGCAAGIAGACDPQQYPVSSSGNTGLKEEKSKSLNVGVVVQPVKSFSAGVDFFFIKMNNVVGINYNDLTAAELSGVNLGDFNTQVTRASDGSLESISSQLQNLAERNVQGIDFSMDYNRVFKSIGAVKIRNEFSYLLKFAEQGFPGTTFTDVLGDNGRPKWRNNLDLEYGPTEALHFALAFNTTGKHKKFKPEEGELRIFTQMDAQVSYSFKVGMKISGGVKNVFGATPPLDFTNTNNKLDETIYDPIGQRFFVAYKQNF